MWGTGRAARARTSRLWGPRGAGQASNLSLGNGIMKARGHVLLGQVLAV